MAKVDTTGLDRLLKGLKRNEFKVRVGILGSNATASHGEGLTNAQVGAFAEYGTAKSPVRSFLRMPLAEHYYRKLKSSGAFDKEAFSDVIKTGSFLPWYEKAAIVAEAVVLEAFDTGGFGAWKPSNMQWKTNHQTLVETQQLRNSITAIVVKTGAK